MNLLNLLNFHHYWNTFLFSFCKSTIPYSLQMLPLSPCELRIHKQMLLCDISLNTLLTPMLLSILLFSCLAQSACPANLGWEKDGGIDFWVSSFFTAFSSSLNIV